MTLVLGKIDISSLISAFSQFQDALKIAKSDLEKAGTIQYFEFTYELAWKTMQRVLAERGKKLNSPKTVIREAVLEGLIDDPEVWFQLTDDRNATVHIYNKVVANSIFLDLHLFENEMILFLSRLKQIK
jgi:nucleotidyltransferase substrate binding protein (TIGR01987 family)